MTANIDQVLLCADYASRSKNTKKKDAKIQHARERASLTKKCLTTWHN